MKRAHLAPIALAFLAGIASDVRGYGLVSLGVGCALASFARSFPIGMRATALGALALGVLHAHAFGHPTHEAGDVRMRSFRAVVLDANASGAGDVEITLRLDDGSRALASFATDPPLVGERVSFRAEREPFDEPRNDGEPSQREREADRGVTWRLVHVTAIARAPPDSRDATLWLPRLRAWASARLHASVDEPGATILAGALWGERGPLPPALRAEFQDTGTVHVLVTAGLHLGVVAALALALLQLAHFGRVSSSLATIAIVWAYAAFSGGHLPAIRAATMLSFALIARAAGREAYSWNALAAAAIAIAAWRPASVTSASFALSFSCVAAIFGFAKPIAHALERRGAPRLVCEIASVSVAAQLGTWPISAATFLVIAPYAPLANAVVVPVVGVTMLAGFASLAFAPIPILAMLANNVVTSLVDWIVAAVGFVGTLPGAHVIATPAPAWTLGAYGAALVAAARLLAARRPAIAFAVVACATALCLWPPRPPNHHLQIDAIDVGQADAILIRTPAGHAYLVDAGGRLERGGTPANGSHAEDVGERTVVPFLVRRGIHHLDAILLSHPHGDHAGGIAPVLRTLGATLLADTGQTYGGHAYRDAVAVARERGTTIAYPRAGTVWRTDDGLTLRFIGPSRPFISGRNAINENSLAFIVTYGRFRMLFTGDAGTLAERRFVYEGVDLHAVVLKVGHHGSAYGSTPEFIAAVHPQAAIVSVGRHNLFGHPAPQTLSTLRDVGARVFRTDEDGEIAVETDGSNYEIRPLLGSAASRAVVANDNFAAPTRQ